MRLTAAALRRARIDAQRQNPQQGAAQQQQQQQQWQWQKN